MTTREQSSKRTRRQIQADIDHAIKAREQFAQMAREVEDKDDRAGLYGNVDNCNQVIKDLVHEREGSRR